jgi:hypothetical protein
VDAVRRFAAVVKVGLDVCQGDIIGIMYQQALRNPHKGWGKRVAWRSTKAKNRLKKKKAGEDR